MKNFTKWVKNNIECIIIIAVIIAIIVTVITLYLTGVINETNTVESSVNEYTSTRLLHHVAHLH